LEFIISERITNIDIIEGKKEVHKIIKNLASGIKVKINIDIVYDGWIRVKLTGEDSEILKELIKRKFGIAPGKCDQIKAGDVYKGFISEINEEFLNLDMGILSPDYCNGICSLYTLQTQLADGFKISMEKIVSKFILCLDLPLEVRVIKVEGKNSILLGMSDCRVDYLKDLIQNPLERIIIIGALSKEIKKAIHKVKAYRDLIGIETQSISSHILTCKLGTNARGIIKKLAPNLEKAIIHSIVSN
jgi:hypothetical protein